MSSHINLGNKGEELAKEFLIKNNFVVLHTNWTYKRLEVDIIAEKGGLLVFVEVKTRSTDIFGLPEEAVGAKKQRNLAKAAAAYLSSYEELQEIRFDIISIIHQENKTTIRHIEDAFFPFQSY